MQVLIGVTLLSIQFVVNIMNERIEQLAKEHGLIHDYMSVGERNDALKKFERFAELIVKETHRKVIASILITDVVMDANGQVPTSEDYIRAINNDFGVEK